MSGLTIKKKLSVTTIVAILLFILGVPLASNANAAGCQTGTGTKSYCAQPDPAAAATQNCDGDKNCQNIFNEYLIPAINLLSAAVGIICVAMIIWGGIEFSSSGGDPQKVANGKKHITNAIIALIAFLFLWAFLNFLVPGGVLHS